MQCRQCTHTYVRTYVRTSRGIGALFLSFLLVVACLCACVFTNEAINFLSTRTWHTGRVVECAYQPMFRRGILKRLLTAVHKTYVHVCTNTSAAGRA